MVNTTPYPESEIQDRLNSYTGKYPDAVYMFFPVLAREPIFSEWIGRYGTRPVLSDAEFLWWGRNIKSIAAFNSYWYYGTTPATPPAPYIPPVTPNICPYDSTLLAGDRRCVPPSQVTPIGQCEGVPDGEYTFGTCKGGQLVSGYVSPAEQYYVPPPPPPQPELGYITYRNYTIWTGSWQVQRPNGFSIGFYSSEATAKAAVDNDLAAPPPTIQPPPSSGGTGAEAIKYTCPNGSDIFVDPKILLTGINPYDLCGATELPAPGQPLTPEQQKAQDAIDASRATEKFNSGQQLTPAEQAALDKYFATKEPEAKDMTGLYILGAAAILGAALLFGGKHGKR